MIANGVRRIVVVTVLSSAILLVINHLQPQLSPLVNVLNSAYDPTVLAVWTGEESTTSEEEEERDTRYEHTESERTGTTAGNTITHSSATIETSTDKPHISTDKPHTSTDKPHTSKSTNHPTFAPDTNINHHGLSPAQSDIIARRFSERKDRIKRECQRLPRKSINNSRTSFIYYAPSYHLFVCVTPKVGSSTWFMHLLNMQGIYPQTKNLHTAKWKTKIKASSQLKVRAIKEGLQSGPSVLTMRHPLTRLLSGYKDKFAGGRKLLKPQSLPHYKFFWKPALKSVGRSVKPPLQISFREFVLFALRIMPWNHHWNPVSKTCYPCDFSYQYILALETFTEDLAFLASTLNISKVNLSERRNMKSANESTESIKPSNPLALDQSSVQYYLQLPSSLMAYILSFYKLDFQLFGYEVPSVILQHAKLQY